MKRFLGLFVLFGILSVPSFADTLKAVSPADGAVVTPLTFAQRFFSVLPVDELEKMLADPLFVDSLKPSESKSIPAGVGMRWEFKGDRGKIHYEMLLGTTPELSDARKILPPHSVYAMQNLIPGQTYFWKVMSVTKEGAVTAETPVKSFTVEDLLPRVVALPDCWNVRDLGGRIALDGRKAPYGKIFRSGGLNYNSSDGGKTPGKNTVTPDSIREALEVLKIRTELDLRWDNEVAGMTQSPLGPSVQYIHIPTKLYGAMYTSEGMENYAELFRIFTHPENYPIDFHCIAGADRTGTLAFLLESVLGYSVEDIRRDYTYTTHYSPRYFAAIDGLLQGMENFGTPAEPLQYKAERYLLRCGITPEEIRAFQEIMLGDGLPESPALAEVRKLQEFRNAFTRKAEFKVVDSAPALDAVKLCGKDYPLRPAYWTDSPVQYTGMDAEGRAMAQLQNDRRRTCYVGIQGLPEGEYYLSEFFEDTLFDSPSPYRGTRWTAAELASAQLPVAGQTRALYLVTPVALGEPVCVKNRPVPKPADLFLTGQIMTSAPVIDGKASDWDCKAMPLADIKGKAMPERGWALLGINEAGDTLYFLATVEDRTPQSNAAPHDSDEAWKGDEIELFLSCAGSKKYYQFIFGRAGTTFDGLGQDTSWNAQGVVSAIADDGKRWSLEAAIPLAQFDFDGAVELNVCVSDQPTTTLYNLMPTFGTFHNREAMTPVRFVK